MLSEESEGCGCFRPFEFREGVKTCADRDSPLQTTARPLHIVAFILARTVPLTRPIDRLTRSLADFTRLVERFDRTGCSFVSVTQSFNTASSMGRLTLNVLLSFAQFEREVTGERIRDKIAASKKKGLWMGGLAPLGYARHPEPQRRELVEVPEEAEMVRTLFRLYDEFGCLRRVADEANRQGIRSKLRVHAGGRTSGGLPLTRGHLHYLLTNPVCRGKVRHRDQIYDGTHPAIVDARLWDRVQAKLMAAAGRGRGQKRNQAPDDLGRRATTQLSQASPALLTGKLRDELDDPLTPTHTQKGRKRYHYYVSHRCLTSRGQGRNDGWRLPARELDKLVLSGIASHLQQLGQAHRLLARPEAETATRLGCQLTALIDALTAYKAPVLRTVLTSGRLSNQSLRLTLDAEGLAALLQIAPEDLAAGALHVELPLSFTRRGVGLRLVSGAATAAPDPKMVSALARAHRWTTELRRGMSLAELARREQRSEALLRTRCALAFLSPSIQAAILEGRHPAGLTLERLIRTPIPHDWNAQARIFGFI
ncbi:recombinase family protein [Paracoccus niistensis]|uniref:Recombinase family protein n=1 Tax=Paracoccus niistensis TaxID=632935 RepID=A0ABV6HYV9_9RHOB